MFIRVATRLVGLLAGLVLATVLLVGALAVLASHTPAQATSLMKQDHVTDEQRGTRAPDKDPDAAGATPTPAIVLVLAGVVVLAAQPPLQRIYVQYRPYQ